MLHGSCRGRSVEIKICGITNVADAVAAIDSGADALGFNLFPGSKRFIEVEKAGDWIAQLPSGIRRVAVLVNPTPEQALRTAKSPFFDSLQLHGNESPQFCCELAAEGVVFTKALAMIDNASLQQPTRFSTRSSLLDS